MKNNILLNVDSYKVGMWDFYPQGTTNVFSYIESRGGKKDKTLFFGLQAFIKEYLTEPLTLDDVNDAIKIWKAHGLNVNEENLRNLVLKHNGFLPIRIRAAKEGLLIPTHNVLVTIEATDPEFYWLTTWLETALLRAVWYPTTVATNSKSIKTLIEKYAKLTGANLDGVAFKLHDFGARGAQSNESAGLGAAAHLVNFMGTDTIAGVVAAMKYYNSDVCGFSIPATEHSISTSFGRENEADYVRNIIRAMKDFNIFATVGDTYNIWNFVDMLGTELKEEIIELGRQGKTLVVRPDSGNPVEVPIEVIERLADHFGASRNEKGYKELPPYIRVIQGDGIEEKTIEEILDRLKTKGFSSDNIAFGMGGKLLGSPQRDDQKFAMKASAIEIDGVWKAIKKDPITDQGKKSKAGRLTLIKENDEYETILEKDLNDRKEELEVVFENGKLLRDMTFEEVRANANAV